MLHNQNILLMVLLLREGATERYLGISGKGTDVKYNLLAHSAFFLMNTKKSVAPGSFLLQWIVIISGSIEYVRQTG